MNDIIWSYTADTNDVFYQLKHSSTSCCS